MSELNLQDNAGALRPQRFVASRPAVFLNLLHEPVVCDIQEALLEWGWQAHCIELRPLQRCTGGQQQDVSSLRK
jgi:hypothetical protein